MPASCCTSCAAAACWRWLASQLLATPPATCTRSLRPAIGSSCQSWAQVCAGPGRLGWGGLDGTLAAGGGGLSEERRPACMAACLLGLTAVMRAPSAVACCTALPYKSTPRAGRLPAGVDALDVCKRLLAHFSVEPSQYQIGRSKLFFRAGVLGQLEDAAARMQRWVGRWVGRWAGGFQASGSHAAMHGSVS
jgi:hypothetical protein